MKKAHGYIAVVSAIIISTGLLLLALANSTSVLWARSEQISQTSHLVNQNLAKSCAYEALIQYTEDPSSMYSNEKIPTISNSFCFIDSIATTSTNQTFNVHSYTAGTYSGIIVNTSKNLQTGVLTITSWRDITSIPP